MTARVYWLKPITFRGSVTWPNTCGVDVTTDETRRNRSKNGEPLRCGYSAKVMYDGTPLCLRHAQARALSEVIEGKP